MGVQVHPEVPKSSESAHSWSSTSPVIQSDSSSTTNSVSSSGTAQKETFLIGAIHRGYRAWARLIARHAILTIVVCSVLSLLGGIKIVNTPNENDITGYSPYGARSRDEYGIFQEFFSQDGLGVSIFVLALAKDGGNVLREEYLNETIQVSNFIAENFTLLNRITGRPENYNEFCYSFCTINVPLLQYHNGLKIQMDLLKSNAPLNPRIQLGYPITRIFDRRMNVQPNFYGIELAEDLNSTSKASNSTSLSTLRRITNLLSAKMIALQYRAEHKGDWTVQDVKEYETRISDYFIKHYKSDRLKVLTLSTTFVVRAGMSLLPFLLVGFAIMGIVSTLTTFLSAFYWEQVSIHKLSLALAACICPFMACGTALGLLFVCGIRFGSILCVTPFLVLAIGVDAAYLMIHAWQRVSKRAREHPVKGDSTAYRLGEVLIDTGPAILISALTNIFADVAGSFTGSPEISLLCYGNMACIFANFIYQITFYSAVMTLAGEFEMKAEQKRHKHSIEIGREEAGDSRESFHQKVKVAFHRLLEVYVDLLTNKLIAFGVIVLWIVYLVGSTYGIIGLEINLTPKKLFAHDSPLLEMDDMRVDYVIPHFMVATVFINKPGDITDPARLARLDNFVAELESLPGAWGPTSTMYFMRDFRDFANSSLEEDAEEEAEDGESPANTGMLNLNYLPAFIKWTEYDFWRGFIRYHKDNATKAVVLDKFFITTGFHGQQLKEWPQRAVLLHSWRQVVDKYSVEFNATVYHDDAVYLDLIDNMPADTWQSAVATLGTMALICGIFMADFFTVVVATAAITSIMAGVLGILSLTGTDLDPIMMSATVISIGFSVDIPAHVTYHYHSAGLHSDRKLTVADRLKYCLRSVGFPALQASLSTNLCVLSLLCVSIYMGQVFVKTMVLCVSLCVLHGLVLIPCLFALIHPLLDYCSYRLKSPPASRSPSKPSTSLQLDETPKVPS